MRENGRITLELVALALLWGFALGVPLGVLAALRRGTLGDRAATTLIAAAVAIPNFAIATVLGWLLAVKAGVLPVFDWDGWGAKLLPSFVLALVPMSLIARVLRAQTIEALASEHVRAARAKGLRRARIMRVHVLRTAVIPVVSMTGPLLGALVTGVFVVEYVFAIPGAGRYFVAAAGAGDYSLILGLTVALTTVIVLANLVSDVTLASLDPRIRG